MEYGQALLKLLIQHYIIIFGLVACAAYYAWNRNYIGLIISAFLFFFEAYISYDWIRAFLQTENHELFFADPNIFSFLIGLCIIIDIAYILFCLAKNINHRIKGI